MDWTNDRLLQEVLMCFHAWMDASIDPTMIQIATFLDGIGIQVLFETIDQSTFLPAMMVRNGALVVDTARAQYPGDMLHEAGHIAVTDTTLRPTLNEVSSDGGEEMAAIAWSYAAALAAGIDPLLVFHDEGYPDGRGNIGGTYLVELFVNGGTMGQPLLHFFGMCVDGNIDRNATGPVYPQMRRWLR